MDAADPHATDRNAADLSGRIALVTGATRGAGRALALELAASGAHVYCTGRSTRTGASDYGRSETIEETAALITDAGGSASAVAVDHRDRQQVESLITRIEDEQGRLDILVNDIGGEAYVDFDIPLWSYDWEQGMKLFYTGFMTHLITSHAALGLLSRTPGGLVVEITDGTREYNAQQYRSTVFLDITKTAVDRLAFAEGHDLEAHGGTAVSVTPGWLRSEMMLDGFGVTEEDWRTAAEANRGRDDAVPPYDFVISETPALLARGVAALAADEQRALWNTRSTSSYELAEHYGLYDVDGSRPDAWSFIAALGSVSVGEIDIGDYR